MLQSLNVTQSKLTRNQHLVLSVLEDADKPLTAYRILDLLRESGLKAPLQVYRALERLISVGRVHRLESLNAFVVCSHSAKGYIHPHFTAFQICDVCGSAAEFHDDKIEQCLLRHAAKSGFTIRNSTIEIHGLCKDCGERC